MPSVTTKKYIKEEFCVKIKKIIFIITALIIIALAAYGCYKMYFFAIANGNNTKDLEKETKLQMICPHKWDSDRGICSICGLHCSHPKFRSESRCKICGVVCTHEEWENGACVACGYKCKHDKYEQECCAVCGEKCLHPEWIDSSCAVCGFRCLHSEYTNGFCSTCGYQCPHEAHNKADAKCEVCGIQLEHHIVNGKCVCGWQHTFYTGYLPDEMYAECEFKGTIGTDAYITYDYKRGSDREGVKEFDYYLPYGYDSEKPYNVFVFFHGAGGNKADCLGETHDCDGRYIRMANIYDNMIAKGLIEPLIIISVNTQSVFRDEDSNHEQMAPEVRNDLIPYIINNFSTYARSSSSEDIIAAREHFGCGGLSNGSLYCLNTGMFYNFDYFANYAAISGDNWAKKITEVINDPETGWDKLPIVAFFAGAGQYDGVRDDSSSGFEIITSSSPERFKVGENSWYVETEFSHDWSTWSTDFYNALLMMFQDTKS